MDSNLFFIKNRMQTQIHSWASTLLFPKGSIRIINILAPGKIDSTLVCLRAIMYFYNILYCFLLPDAHILCDLFTQKYIVNVD